MCLIGDAWNFTIKDYDIISGFIRINGLIQNFYQPF